MKLRCELVVDNSESGEFVSGGGRRNWALAVMAAVALVVLLLLSPLWPLPLLDKLDVVGSAVCGRLPDHSFHLAGRQLPLC
ncbi:MAG: DUF2085 domain-containing protein, partial [Anaerolineae bacterium]|nr:DUF2085 domain-containing protein [Anaerolineae bacterium]